VLLGSPPLATKGWDTDTGEVVDDRLRRAAPEGDICQYGQRRRTAAEPSRTVDEDTNTLIAGPWQAKPLRLTADSPAGLRDRNVRPVEANDCRKQAWRDTRCEGGHRLELWRPKGHESVSIRCR
jgi:hypothetical protein